MKYVRYVFLTGPLLTWFLFIWFPFLCWLFGERIIALRGEYKLWNEVLIDEFYKIKSGDTK